MCVCARGGGVSVWGAKLTRCVRAPGVRCAHPRARARAKEAFPAHESVLKKKCAQTKTSSKKTQKTFLEVALARETNFMLPVLFTCLLPPRNFPQKQPPVFF